MPSEKGSPWSESNYHRSVLNTKLKIWLRRNLFGEFGQTESTSAVKILLMGNNALLFLACLICCCNLRHCGCLPCNTSSRLPFSLVHHDACCLVRDLLRDSGVTRSIWPSARWRRIGEPNSSFPWPRKKGNKTFSALKLEALDFFIPTLFDESKKKFASYTL